MSARGFHSVFMVAAVASAALGCYLVSLRVASERASLEGVETKIVLAQRDIRLLETEIGTRGRLAQLERWNARAVQLSAPSADQFVETGYQLATLVKPEPRPAVDVPVVLAAAPLAGNSARAIEDLGLRGAANPLPSRSASAMMHVASYERPALPSQPEPAAVAGASSALRAAKVQAAAKPSKPVKSADADPLAPLPTAMRATAAPVKLAVKSSLKPTAKESGTH